MVAPALTVYSGLVLALELAPMAALTLHARALSLCGVVPGPAQQDALAPKVPARHVGRYTAVCAEDPGPVSLVKVIRDDGQMGLQALGGMQCTNQGVGCSVKLVILVCPDQCEVDIGHVC